MLKSKFMDITYYGAFVLSLLTAGYGVVLIVLSVIEIVRGYIRGSSLPLLSSLHFVNGLINLGVGSILYWRLESSDFSSYSTLGMVIVFALLENFTRKYYTKRLEQAGSESG